MKYLKLKEESGIESRCITWQKNYLKNVCIFSENKCLNLCQNPLFLKELFDPNSFYNLSETERKIKNLEAIKNEDTTPKNEEDKFYKRKWDYCGRDCFKELYRLIQNEINSTAYMLRLLSNSIITTENGSLQFEYDNGKLTGLWEKDRIHFKIKNLGKNVNNRLIFGFGPSASGKTYWAENVIKLFSLSDISFPKTFLSIDGGLHRKFSAIYQYIINNLNKNDVGGFYNLVTAGIGRSKSLFSASKIKKKSIEYLKTQNSISLYVPLTLGGCLKSWCYSDYKDYIELSNDKKWIGLLIYQHKTGLECPYRKEYRCIGCTESGKDRESTEGKKYSATAYHNSMTNGLYAIKKSIGGILEIHNTGGYTYKDIDGNDKYAKSIIKEHPINGKYIFDDIPDEFNSVYIHA